MPAGFVVAAPEAAEVPHISGEKEVGMGVVWRATSKLANHEAESAYVTGESGAAGNVMKFSEICALRRGAVHRQCLLTSGSGIRSSTGSSHSAISLIGDLKWT